MSGAVFVVTIPKAEYEEEIKKKARSDRLQELKTSGISTPILIPSSRSDSKSSYTTADGCLENCSANCYHKGDWIKNPEFKDPINEPENHDHKTDVLEHIKAETEPAEQVIRNVLQSLNISDAAWTSSRPETFYQIQFSVYGRNKCEQALYALRNAGIGSRAHTSFNVLPCALHYKPENADCIDSESDASSPWAVFVRSVRARQTVHQLVEQVKNDASLTFDFLSLLVVAALVAAMGLVENSTMFLVASMLISPLMGPITASTFGTTIRDRNLFKIGVLNEFVGLSLAMVIGFLFGLIVCAIDEKYGQGQWPTQEIMARCDIRSLWVGILVAVPSGAAVAISVLSDNTATLVGVAISASLLPPAVNAGLLWGMSLIHLYYLEDETKFNNVIKTNVHSDNPAIELAVDGLISLGLTLVNIICIYFAGIIVYMIKEVAPVNSSNIKFWKLDIKAARDFNKTLSADPSINPTDGDIIIKNLESSLPIFTENNSVNPVELFDRLNYISNHYMTWSPNRSIPRRISVREIQGLHKQFVEESSIRRSKVNRSLSNPPYKRLSEENLPKIAISVPEESSTENLHNNETHEITTVVQMHEPK